MGTTYVVESRLLHSRQSLCVRILGCYAAEVQRHIGVYVFLLDLNGRAWAYVSYSCTYILSPIPRVN